MRGSEILPSGRTGTVRETSGSFHTVISSMSCGPITYAGSVVAGTAFDFTGFVDAPFAGGLLVGGGVPELPCAAGMATGDKSKNTARCRNFFIVGSPLIPGPCGVAFSPQSVVSNPVSERYAEKTVQGTS